MIGMVSFLLFFGKGERGVGVDGVESVWICKGKWVEKRSVGI